MKFQQEKKREVRLYLLEKIARGDQSISRTTAENFGINQNTVHSYLNELAEEGSIRRVGYGRYELVGREYSCTLRRSEGELEDDSGAYLTFLLPHLEKCPENVKEIWAYTFSEMLNNVIDHSGAESVLIQIRQSEIETTVLMMDDGIGIFEKIRSYFHYATLEDAISELFKGKLTTDSRRHSGEGIFFSSRIMDTFAIFSDGKVFSCTKYDPGVIRNLPEPFERGTCVVMSLSNQSRKKAGEIFDMFAGADSGFSRTRIPVKNMFETAPISRSQAKRVASRLELFAEVELDFDGVEWIGQGFAHQLFVVFREDHPEIRLIPIHSSPGVEKMIRHVTAQNPL